MAQQELDDYGARRAAMICASGEKIPIALSIAGSDSSAGAGIQADLKTFSTLGVYGATVITAITAQNTQTVSAIHPVPSAVVTAQMDAVFSDLRVAAIKTGMLGEAETVSAVVQDLQRWAKGTPLIVDPVMVSTSGRALLSPDARAVVAQMLIPLATLITPNLLEAASLLQTTPAQNGGEMQRQAEDLMKLGPRAVLLKGGHGEGAQATDIFFDGQTHHTFSTPRIDTRNTHGTGCTLASAITAYLVRGEQLAGAIANAKLYVQNALQAAQNRLVGEGAGPLWHFSDAGD